MKRGAFRSGHEPPETTTGAADEDDTGVDETDDDGEEDDDGEAELFDTALELTGVVAAGSGTEVTVASVAAAFVLVKGSAATPFVAVVDAANPAIAPAAAVDASRVAVVALRRREIAASRATIGRLDGWIPFMANRRFAMRGDIPMSSSLENAESWSRPAATAAARTALTCDLRVAALTPGVGKRHGAS
jgi:hypothetical protein